MTMSSLFFCLLLASLSSTTTATTTTTSSSPKKKLLYFPILPHHEVIARRHRERKLFTDKDYGYDHVDTLEVNGLYQGYGTHYVDLWVGTPPQRQTVIVDTGSGITAFPCEECADCGDKYHVDQFFQESESETFVKFGCNDCVNARCSNSGKENEYCHLSVSYQEGSMWNAYQGQDVTYVGGMHEYFVVQNDGIEEPDDDENDAVKVDDDELTNISNYSKSEPVKGKGIGGLIHGENPENAADYKFDMVFGCQTKITGLFKTQLVSITL